MDARSHDERERLTLFLCGDVMTGRGIDQILPHPSDPAIYEPWMVSAEGYVELAERATGPLPRAVDPAYIWGDALAELQRVAPDARIINLETAVTTSDEYWRGKGINYRMHPANVPCLTAAGIDGCALANNHVLDWGYAGLEETLRALRGAGIAVAGAGASRAEAEAPAVIDVRGKGRVILFSFGFASSGIPPRWAATPDRPGVCLLEDCSPATVRRVARLVGAVRGPRDIVVASIHWGPNWGYAIPPDERAFAHALVRAAGVDVVHGHSSHHPKGIEVQEDRPIFYGCGDFLNDYEGIRGHERFRGDLGLMYFATFDLAARRLAALRMTPTQVRHFRVNRASSEDARWLAGVLDREGRDLGTRVGLGDDDRLTLRWG